jgi:DGQHR domain-containing protein
MPQLQVMKAKALDYNVYLGSAPLKNLGAVSFVDRAVMDQPEGFQRELDRGHALRFKEFIKNPKSLRVEKATAPPLIFSLRMKARFEEIADGYGILHVPDRKEALARLDAQHRMAETEGFEERLPFVIYDGLQPTEEVGIFTIINDEHKGLTKSLVDKHRARLLGAELPEEEPHLAIAVKLNDDSASPWFKAIDTGGVKTPGTKRRVTLRTLQEATREMISGPRCQNADFTTKYRVVLNFWKAVVKLFPNEWANPRKHLITKGIGVHALGAVGRDVIEARIDVQDYSSEAFEKALSKLANFDWGNKTSVFSVVGGKKGVKFATALLNRIIFGSVSVADVWEEAKKIKIGR